MLLSLKKKKAEYDELMEKLQREVRLYKGHSGMINRLKSIARDQCRHVTALILTKLVTRPSFHMLVMYIQQCGSSS